MGIHQGRSRYQGATQFGARTQGAHSNSMGQTLKPYQRFQDGIFSVGQPYLRVFKKRRNTL